MLHGLRNKKKRGYLGYKETCLSTRSINFQGANANYNAIGAFGTCGIWLTKSKTNTKLRDPKRV